MFWGSSRWNITEVIACALLSKEVILWRIVSKLAFLMVLICFSVSVGYPSVIPFDSVKFLDFIELCNALL